MVDILYPLFFLFIGGSTISDLMINEQIRDKEVRVISSDGEQLGIMSAKEAQKLADDEGLDLVKISPKANPPVCKIVDYGKFRYEQARKEKEAKKKQHVVEVKEIRMSPNIDANDMNTKINAAKKFISKGDKVKVSIKMFGRQMAHPEISVQVLEDFFKKLEDVAVLEKKPTGEGRITYMMLAPIVKK